MTFEEIFQKAYELTEQEVQEVAKLATSHYAEALKQMDNQLKNVYLKILEGVPKEEYFNYMSKAGRLETLIASMEKVYLDAAKKAGKEVFEASKIAISNTYYRQVYAAQWVVDPATNYVLNVLNPAVIDVSVYGTPQIWAELKKSTLTKIEQSFGALNKYQPKYGTLIDILTANRAKDLVKINQSINQSLITGQSYQRTTDEIAKLIDSSQSDILRIVRTESQRNMMAGNLAMTNDARAQGVDGRRMIVSTLDNRSRPQSAQVDGQKEDGEGYFTYPGGVKVAIPGNSGVAKWDINDRESVIFQIDGVEPTVRRAKNPAKVKAWEDATAAERKDWRNNGLYPPSQQTDIISYQSFDQWAKANNLTKNKYGQIYSKE